VFAQIERLLREIALLLRELVRVGGGTASTPTTPVKDPEDGRP